MLGWDLKKIVAIFVLVSVIIVTLNFTGFSRNIKDFFFCLSSPIQKSFWQGGKNVSDFLMGVLRAGAFKKEAEDLRLENQELLVRIAGLLEQEKENEVLREALDLGLEKESELVLVRVINKDISQDSVLVNKGEEDGISAGMTVITEQKVILGRIGAVYSRFSEVVLISNENSSFGATILEREVDGVIKGKGGSGLSFDLIPKEKEIFENDVVVTSALGGVYPSGLLVGKVKTVHRSDVDPFQNAEITPAFDIGSLDYLFILH
jgi:rod shape-determining protein MreC